MLSICIPIYNYEVGRLVRDLHLQAEKVGYPFEILLMDDASEEKFREMNQAIHLEAVRYIQLNENIGRSKIRNRLAEEARFPRLLFMDCDSAVSSSCYIENYTPFFESQTVCCGGRIYEDKAPTDSTYLRWKYGVARECAPASEREKNPNAGFQTNNFLIHKHIFEKVKFNEDLTGYGHEDTLFGLELSGQGIVIRHIDNPLIHLGLESASEFLEKTENGIKNLYRVELLLREKYPEYINHSRIMRSKLFLQKLHLSGFTSKLFGIMRQPMKNRLLGKKPSLMIFDLYRLGLLCGESDNKMSDNVESRHQ
ncbi:MAG: glycosyltransferase [Candidatus Azobacteroides sp.]|nr:glycosyltransferase [Candidatus Azobacteroides sp.]